MNQASYNSQYFDPSLLRDSGGCSSGILSPPVQIPTPHRLVFDSPMMIEQNQSNPALLQQQLQQPNYEFEVDVTFKSLIGSHKLHMDEDDEQFDITRNNHNQQQSRPSGEVIQQARSVGVISEDQKQKIDGIRPMGSRNHFQGGYYTTSTKIQPEQQQLSNPMEEYSKHFPPHNRQETAGSTVLQGSTASPSMKDNRSLSGNRIYSDAYDQQQQQHTRKIKMVNNSKKKITRAAKNSIDSNKALYMKLRGQSGSKNTRYNSQGQRFTDINALRESTSMVLNQQYPLQRSSSRNSKNASKIISQPKSIVQSKSNSKSPTSNNRYLQQINRRSSSKKRIVNISKGEFKTQYPLAQSVLSTATVMVPSENTSIAANRSTQASEVEKWKKFGYLMAESYDELKKENEKIKLERDKDRKIMVALKDQVDKLRQIIRATRGGTSDYDPLEQQLELRNAINERDQTINDINQRLSQAQAEILGLHEKIILMTNSINSPPSIQENKEQQINFFKKLSQQQLKESSQLADELICLRSDLDQPNVQLSNSKVARANSQSLGPHRRNPSYASSSCHKHTSNLPSYENSRTNSVMKLNGFRSAMKNEPAPVTCVVLNETPKQQDLVQVHSQKYSMTNSEILSPKVSSIGERGREFQMNPVTPASQKDSSINTGNASNSRRHHQLLSQDSQIIRQSISPLSVSRGGIMNSTHNQSDIKAQQMLSSFQQESRAGLSMERRQSQISEDEKQVQSTFFEYQAQKISHGPSRKSQENREEDVKNNNEQVKYQQPQPVDSQIQSSRNSEVGNTTSRFNTMTLSSVNEPIILSNQNQKYQLIMRQPSFRQPDEQPLRNQESQIKDEKETAQQQAHQYKRVHRSAYSQIMKQEVTTPQQSTYSLTHVQTDDAQTNRCENSMPKRALPSDPSAGKLVNKLPPC